MGLSFFSYTSINLVFSFSLFYLTLSHFAFSRQPLCHDNERSALLQFKASLIIDSLASSHAFAYPKVSSWKAEEENGDCCSWDGITCNEDTGHVTKLDLTSSYLYGSLNSSSSLFHLVHLEWLSLDDNDFNYSKIPSEIINLSKLSHLDLSSSRFSGEIPSEILGLSRLVNLDLSHNRDLELKSWVLRSLPKMLRNLKMLDLSQVKINSSIPQTFTNLFSLTDLSLESCGLRGVFPSKIFQLPNLYFLNVRSNIDLTGHLPRFEKISPLQELKLAYTNFSGEIPDSIGNLQSLAYLEIVDCNFSGKIPLSVCSLTQIRFLAISSNKFVGGPPSCISNLGSLKELHLVDHSFLSQNSRTLSWIANLTKLAFLDLSWNNLMGEIPNWLLNLTQLTILAMEDNKLTGPIPSWLMNLKKLKELYLWNNQLTGVIPFEIRNLTQLTTLHLKSNLLEGSIPSSISQLKNLQILHLGFNKLGGTLDLDMFLHDLKSLEGLYLSSNNLSLHVKTTPSFNHSQKFFALQLGSCNLRDFPSFLQKQEHLMSLDLSSNKIAGRIPRWLINVSINKLEYLNLSYNQLIGFDQHPIVLPWTSLTTLDLRFNKLQGVLPFPSVSVQTYLVSNNQLKGDIPPWICSLNKLFGLDLSYNNLSGMLPQCLGNFSDQLSILRLQRNNFHGSIPKIFMHGTNLRMIDLSQNQLEGRIPRSIANCMMLEFLNLGNNQINDEFPSWLGTLPRLRFLILHKNKFHGVIKEPEIDVQFPRLQIIDLSYNKFAGDLPSKYFESWNSMKVVNASSLTYLRDDLWPATFPRFTDYGAYYYSLTLSNKGIELEYQKLSNLVTCIILSNNEFEGGIPASIGNLKGLYSLNLSNNNFQGQIPSSLGNLTLLESLDLSKNGLSGEIPHQLGELTSLAVFDVSYNHLKGPIPQGTQFSTFENASFDGNPGLCGKPLSIQCENSKSFQKEDEGSNTFFAFGWKVVVIGFGSGLIPGVILGHFFTTRKQKWFAKTFGLQLKAIKRKRGHRGRM